MQRLYFCSIGLLWRLRFSAGHPDPCGSRCAATPRRRNRRQVRESDRGKEAAEKVSARVAKGQLISAANLSCTFEAQNKLRIYLDECRAGNFGLVSTGFRWEGRGTIHGRLGGEKTGVDSPIQSLKRI